MYSFVHAAMQRPDAYTAADKLTKPAWLVILGVAGLFSWVLGIMGLVLAAVATGFIWPMSGRSCSRCRGSPADRAAIADCGCAADGAGRAAGGRRGCRVG